MAASGVADAIVVAAGASTRMGGVDKIMAPINGRPLLAWTLASFQAHPAVARIVLVVDGDTMGIDTAPWLPTKVTQIVLGGKRRQDSVAGGVEILRARTRGHPRDDRVDRVVLVHDGARPVVSSAVISSVIGAAREHGAAIPVLPVVETVKRLEGEQVVATLDRTSLATAQTPQGVRISLLLDAYDRFPPSGPDIWTDEAALLEASGITVHAVAGDPSNIKVTVPADLELAAALLGATGAQNRSGVGHDRHPFGPGEPLRLGGIEIAGAPRLHGHSDGDVVLHAVADALLGAAALGDLGRLYPAGPATPLGVASTELLAAVVARLTGAGWRASSIDLTIVGARPRLAPYLEPMRQAIASLLGVRPEQVSVKASTGNLGGEDGAGRSISALALATIEAAT